MVMCERWLAICLAPALTPLISLSPVLALDMDVNNIDIPDEKIDNEENDNTGIKFSVIH